MKRRLQRRLAGLACWFLRWQDDSNYSRHARAELTALGYTPDPEILELLAVLGVQGHSGGSLGATVSLFTKLATFEPLGPLTGAPGEWMDVSDMSDDPLWQNVRCSHVFKGGDDRAYDIEGRIFREPDGCTFTNRDSRVFVTFPYVPVREYVDVPARADE